ncbi:hypothetical protein B0H11DRAFT_1936991 [Mycena galericulata]|nr:hypothetical protein B0H11DRAFT_1936991 [Mycena galericulata]
MYGKLHTLPLTEVNDTDGESGVITPIYADDGILLQSTMFYSTIPIIDSNNVRGPWVNLHPPMNTSVSTIQLFQCLHDPVNQTAVVDAQSRQIQVVEPDVCKSASTWQPYVGPSHDLTVESIFDIFPLFHKIAPQFQMVFSDLNIFNAADKYLFQKLNLVAFWENESAQATANVTLNDVENALSELFATMVWTVGNVPPPYGSVNNCSNISCTDYDVNPFILLSGNAAAMETITQARLDVAAGLIASIILLFLSLPFGGLQNDTELPITELGVLHTIWLYRNHPELESLLLQVEHPTTQKLREAGLVPTRLAESNSEQRRICQSFELEGNLCAVNSTRTLLAMPRRGGPHVYFLHPVVFSSGAQNAANPYSSRPEHCAGCL